MALTTKRKGSRERLTIDKYFNLIEHAADGIAILQDGVFKLVNTALAHISGYDKEELLGMPFAKLLTPESQRLAMARYKARLAGKEVPPIYEIQAVTKDGQVRDIEINAALTEYEGRAADEVIVRDITERKQAEEALRQSEENLKTYLESAPDGVYINDLQGTFLYGNKKAEEIIGYQREELIGNSFLKLNLLPAKYLAKAGKLLALNAMGRATGPDELELIRKDDSRVWVEINTTPIKQEGKTVVLGFVRDISERKRMEEEIRVSGERYRHLFENLNDAAFLADAQTGQILETNRQGGALLGMSRNEITGMHQSAIHPPGKAEEYKQRFAAHVAKGHTADCDGEVIRKDGTIIPVSISASPLTIHGHHLILGLFHDITERKRAEEEREELGQKAHLASRLASVGEMASGIAHEINNPLTGVIGFSHLLMSRDIPDDMKQDLKVINSEAQRVAKVVENLLTFAHQRKPGREYVDINSIVARVLELRSYEMKVNNIEVETQLAPDLPLTMADVGQLQQVFLNIILNAEHFMTTAHSKGKLLVKTERIADNIRASFTDDGSGISKEDLDKIFNPFFTTKQVGNGTGLGLSICHGIIAQHKGRIYAQSKFGQGATFVVELPIVDDSNQAKQAEVTKDEPEKPRGAKILVVDDEPTILAFLCRLLTEWGHSVETINNANAALEKLKTERYSLILLDIKLPGMSGVELYRHIEAIAPALTRRVMFITGDIMETATQDFLDRAKVPHITKPLNIELLKKDINRILTEGAQRLVA